MEELIKEYLNFKSDLSQQSDSKVLEGLLRRQEFLNHCRDSNIPEVLNDAYNKRAFPDNRETHFDRIILDTLVNIAEPLNKLIPILEKADNFMEIWQLINNSIRHIYGVGDLVVYDIALRVALTFNGGKWMPIQVFLHANPLKSAQLMGIAPLPGQPYVSRDLFDRHTPVFKNMRSQEIENFLCVYYNKISELYKGDKLAFDVKSGS